jgi:hypothetical protein
MLMGLMIYFYLHLGGDGGRGGEEEFDESIDFHSFLIRFVSFVDVVSNVIVDTAYTTWSMPRICVTVREEHVGHCSPCRDWKVS